MGQRHCLSLAFPLPLWAKTLPSPRVSTAFVGQDTAFHCPAPPACHCPFTALSPAFPLSSHGRVRRRRRGRSTKPRSPRSSTRCLHSPCSNCRLYSMAMAPFITNFTRGVPKGCRRDAPTVCAAITVHVATIECPQWKRPQSSRFCKERRARPQLAMTAHLARPLSAAPDNNAGWQVRPPARPGPP